MTEDQLRYWTLQENKRHSQVTEQETQRHNLSTESIDLGKLAETAQHNRATEAVDVGQLAETVRHNKAAEGIDLGKLSETVRHNVASEALESRKRDIESQALVETIRHNATTEDIDRTYKEAQAASLQLQNKLKAEGLELEAKQLANDMAKWQAQLSEAKRHNKVSETQAWVEKGTQVLKAINDVKVSNIKVRAEALKALTNLLRLGL